MNRQRDFYLIESVRNVAAALNYAVENAAIVVVTGGYGVGKTEAVKHWRAGDGRKVEAVTYEFDEFSSAGVVQFIGDLAELLGVEYTGGHANGGKTMRAVCTALIAEPRLLVFDQVETVRPRILSVLRQIWDRTRHAGVGVVLLAAPVLMERLTASKMRDLEALSSRVGAWIQLKGVSRAEMADIVKQEGLEVSPEVLDAWWKATRGSMRRLLAIRAAHSGRELKVKTITGVAEHLWGMAA